MIIMEIVNRKARHDFFIEKEIEAGLVLLGTEIKSIRQGKCDIKDTYAKIMNNEIIVLNMYIAKYEQGNRFNHDERRTRKLLLHKHEITKLKQKVEREGYTLVPLKIYFKGGNAKLLIGLAKGKKTYDKRQVLKERDVNMEIKRKQSLT